MIRYEKGSGVFSEHPNTSGLTTRHAPPAPPIARVGLAYHVLNRRVGRPPLFETSGEYAAFEEHPTGIPRADACVDRGVLLPHAHPLACTLPLTADRRAIVGGPAVITVTHAQHWQGPIAIRLGFESPRRPCGRPKGS